MKTFFSKYRAFAIALLSVSLLLLSLSEVNAADRYSVSSNNWNNTATWSATSGGASGASVPGAGDNVILEGGWIVTVTVNASCAILTFSGTAATLTINSPRTLAVTGAVTVNSNAAANASFSITGAGILTCASFAVGAAATPSADATTTLTSTVSDLTVSGNLTLNGLRSGGDVNDPTFNLASGAVTVGGTLTTVHAHSSNTTTFSMATGAQTGTLVLSGATTFTLSGTGTNIITLNGTGATVNYSGGAQTALPTTYTSLTLSGSGAKTFATTPTVSGILSMEGTATVTVTTGVVTYGGAATLQYNTATARTTSAEEWISPFGASGGVIIANTGTITLDAGKTINSGSSLTINSGATLNPGATTTTTISGGVTFLINGTLDFSNASGAIRSGTSGTSTLSLGATGLIRTVDDNGLGPVALASFTTQVGGAWDMTSISTNGTVEYNRNATSGQIVTDRDYNNLTITGSTQTKTWTLTAARTVNGTVTINASAPLTLSGAQIINVKGNWANSGTFTAGTGTIAFNGTSAQTISGSSTTTFNNLTADNSVGVTISSSTTVSGTFLLTNSGVVNTTGGTTTLGGSATMTINPLATYRVTSPGTANFAGRRVTIKSDATGTGKIGTLTGVTPIILATDVQVERFIPQRAGLGRAYRFLTSSVNTTADMRTNWMETGQVTTAGGFSDPFPGYGTHITGSANLADNFDITLTNQSSLYTATNGGTASTLVYTPVPNASGTMSATQGYFVYIRGNRSESLSVINGPGSPTSATTLRTTGTILTGTQTSFGTMVGGAGSLNVVTNPYESPIDWSLVQPACTNIGDSYTLWDPNFGPRGGFVTVNTAGVASSGAANQHIQSGQAFFVESTGGVPTISIQEAHKSAVNNNGVFRPTILFESFRAELFFTEQPSGFRRIADGVIALYDNAYSAGLDGKDASEINNWDENIAIARDGKHLAIECRPVIILKDTLFLFMNNMRQMAYEFEFTPSLFTNAGLKAELIDNFLGTRSVLSVTAGTVVSFTVTADAASSASDRFMIVFGPQAPLAVDLITIRANKTNNGVQVDWTSRTETDMDHYEVEKSTNGINFAVKTTVVAIGNSTGSVDYSWFDANPVMGNNFYRVRGFDRTGNSKYSQVVKVLFGKNEPGIVVYPNPIVGNSFTVDMNNMEKGIYSLRIISNLGQEVYSEAIQHDGGSMMKTISMKQTLPNGAYQVVLKGENGINLTQKVVKN